MKISKLEINNYRLLKNFSLDLENELSLIIGKNNTGKTSILSILDKFLGNHERTKFSYEDFNLKFNKDLCEKIQSIQETPESDFNNIGIYLRIYIEYDDRDDLSTISSVMMDLDPNNNVIVLEFSYSLDFARYSQIRKNYQDFKNNESIKKRIKNDYTEKEIRDFLRTNQSEYFKVKRKSIAYNPIEKTIDALIFVDLDKEALKLSDIINFKYISARRDVTNKDMDKTLSTQTSRIYRRTEATDEKNNAVEDFKDKLSETDTHLSGIYKILFEKIVGKIKKFGGIKINESEIEIISTLQHRELLEGNTTVIYKHDKDNQLPEHYNGLGYLNLISMIFEIEILLHEFKRKKEKGPAAVNLLFIEEPEAHTHPQMQYVFIKNIKEILADGILCDDGQHRELQFIITTHSASIVADSDFEDIKYLKKDSDDVVLSKNLKDLKEEYNAGGSQYHFLTQYLTISRAEIFFADKAILIEGDTERLLLSTIMKKMDIEEKNSGKKYDHLPFLSQNISIVEVGAYSQIFEKFIDFVGIKSLIITDLDTVDDDGKTCRVESGVDYSNGAIKFFFRKQKNDQDEIAPNQYTHASLKDLTSYNIQNKIFKKINGEWKNIKDGQIGVIYQTVEDGYNARSFEDAFIHLNHAFVKNNKDTFNGLKNKGDFETTTDSYVLAANCIKKKTHFALDILYHSNDNFSNWQIPAYIKEGLSWLKED